MGEEKIPKNKIVCVKCGAIKGVTTKTRKKRIEKFGSEEKLIAEYICRDCRRKAKEASKDEA